MDMYHINTVNRKSPRTITESPMDVAGEPGTFPRCSQDWLRDFASRAHADVA